MTGLLVMLFLDAALLVLASWITNDVLSGRAITVDSFWWALLAALVTSAVQLVLEVILGRATTTSTRFA